MWKGRTVQGLMGCTLVLLSQMNMHVNSSQRTAAFSVHTAGHQEEEQGGHCCAPYVGMGPQDSLLCSVSQPWLPLGGGWEWPLYTFPRLTQVGTQGWRMWGATLGRASGYIWN